MTTTTTLSSLLRHPIDVIGHLDEGDVLLTRRDGESLRLSKDSDAAETNEMVSAVAHLIAEAVLEESLSDRVAANLSGPFPWVEFLPDEARREFTAEFLRTLRACASVARFNRLSVVVGNWRETAIAYSLGLHEKIADLDYIAGGTAVPDPRDQ